MNNKRWIALAVAALILIGSVFAPNYMTIEEEKANEYFSNFFTYQLFKKKPKAEDVIEGTDANNRIAIVSLDGTIAAKSPYGPGYTHEDLIDQLEDIKEDPTVKGLLFILNTGGGTIFESEEIRQEILGIKDKGIPVYVSMKNMTASGGYYIASQADKIYAYPDTVTGSIGVVLQSIDTTGLQRKLGVEVKEYTAGELKRVDKKSDEETQKKMDQVYQAYVDEGYGRFVDIVAQGRGMDRKEVEKIADGRIYTAYQAQDLGLIDEIGSTDQALAALKEEIGVNDPQVYNFIYPSSAAFPFAMGSSGKNELEMFQDLVQNAHKTAPQAYYLYGGE